MQEARISGARSRCKEGLPSLAGRGEGTHPIRAVRGVARGEKKELVGLYLDIGQLIVERQQSEGWGKSVEAQLAADPQAAFPGTGGFSASTLRRMKSCFETYSGAEELAPLVREIDWGHNLIILERCGDAQEREFYLRMAGRFGWSNSVLTHQIDNKSYGESLLGQTYLELARTPALCAPAKLVVEDECAFDFLEFGERHNERDLESALIARIEGSLRAMGGMFAFMGSQYRLEVEGKEYFIDLREFHRRLHVLVAIEFKIGEFEPEFVGKMQFYLAALDAQVREEDESPSIGNILCNEKTRTIVEYAPRDAREPIGMSTYEIAKTLPMKPRDQWPSPETIARLLESI